MALLDYLSERRASIEAQMKALRAELAEIRIAEEALAGNSPSRTAVVSSKGSSLVRAGSIKDWVLKALAHEAQGLETDGVISKVSEVGGPDVPRNSMTPQLSRLKADGLIEQHGRLWRLLAAGQAQNDKASDAGTSDALDEDSYGGL